MSLSTRETIEGVEREAGQGEREIKKTQAEVEGLRKKVVGTGWSTEMEQASEAVMRRAKGDGTRCLQVGVNFLFTRRFLVNN